MRWIRRATLLLGLGALSASACRGVLGIDEPSPTELECLRDEHCRPGERCEAGTCRSAEGFGGSAGKRGSSHEAGAGGAPLLGGGDGGRRTRDLPEPAVGGEGPSSGSAAGAGGEGDIGISGSECEPEETTCLDGWEVRCDRGRWVEVESCSHGCEGDQCAECAVGETRCADNRFFTCTDEGTWDEGEACSVLCVAALGCADACVPSERQCEGRFALECDEGGAWTRHECPFVCRNGDCAGECRPGERSCEGNTSVVCKPDGRYDTQPCDHGCVDGECLWCESGDDLCPSGCTYQEDTDCRYDLGEPCTSSDECRLGNCRDGFCCDRACDGECEACDLPRREGTCSPFDFDADIANCGGCGHECSSENIDARCTDGECDGECREGFRDCDGDKATNGCEIDIRSDPAHCGACGSPCEYPACRDGECPIEWGFPGAGTDVLHFQANTLAGTRIDVTRRGELVALGAVTSTPGVKLRLGLYTASDSSGNPPQDLIAQTEELVAANGKTWGAVPSQMLEPGTYWVFFVAADLVGIELSGSADEQWATAEWDFEDEAFPPVPLVRRYSTLARGHVYAVLVH